MTNLSREEKGSLNNTLSSTHLTSLMPRRKNKNSRRGRKTLGRQYTADHIRIENFSTLKAGSGASTFNINPAGLGSRVTALADLYEMYRVVALRVRFHPVNSRAANSALCFVPGVTDTAPSSYINITESPVHLVYSIAAVTPSAWLQLNRATLTSYCGKSGWLKTVVGTPDTAEEIQGNIYLNGSAANDPFIIEFEGTIEFRAAVESGATPAMRRDKLLADEFKRMQLILTEGARAVSRMSTPSPAVSSACLPGSG